MSSNNKCRLCFDNINEEQPQLLYDGDGRCTQIYEITVKYFDPMLLVNDENDENEEKSRLKEKLSIRSTAICITCWDHIRQFHDFQQTVLKTQSKLLEDFEVSMSAVKVETEIKIENVHDDNLGDVDPMDITDYRGNDEDYDDKDDLYNNDDDLQSNIDLYKNDVKEPNNDDDDKDDIITETNKIDILTKKLSKKQKVPRARKSKSKLKTKTKIRKPKKSKQTKVDDDDAANKTAVHYNKAEITKEFDSFISEVKPQLECDICKETLDNYNDLRRHFTVKHNAKCYVLCCGKKLNRRYLLVEHLKIHVNPDAYQCDICGVSSGGSRSLNSHKYLMHGNAKMFECEICHKKCKTKPNLARHMEVHNDGPKDFKCPHCERCYASKNQLKDHMNKLHRETQICDQCGTTVHGKSALKQHIMHQHSSIKPTKFPCDQCDTQLSTRKSLKAHKLALHNDGLTAFICSVCGKIASSEGALLRHKKYVHETVPTHKCQYCDKAFKKKYKLREHLSTHTGEHLYQCPHCSQTFGNSANMHNHRKKAHPVEFAASRENRIEVPRVDLNCVIKEVVL